jgi:hypothetical protein
MAEEKDRSIFCDSSRGPIFSGIWVVDNCNASSHNDSYLGVAYVNDTQLDGRLVLTGSQWFTVKEIEVFEITG